MKRSRLERSLRGRQRHRACRTGKVRYHDLTEAKAAIRAIRAALTAAGVEVDYRRAYWCPYCANYHLTSRRDGLPETALA